MKKKLIIAAIVIRYHRGSYALHALHSVLGKSDYCCIIRCRCCCRMGGSCGL